MKAEIEKIMAEIEAERVSDRERISLYVSKTVFKKFQKRCGERSASRIAEKLMHWFTQSSSEIHKSN